MFAVRGNLRLEACLPRLGDHLFFGLYGISEQLVLIFGKRCRPDSPVAVSFGCVVQGPAVSRETYASFLLGCVGDAGSGLVLYRCHEDIASENDGYFLSVRGYGKRCRS